MKPFLWGIVLAVVSPGYAAAETQNAVIEPQFNGLNIQWTPFGAGAPTDSVESPEDMRAITLSNNSEQRVLCEFVAAPDRRQSTPTPKLVLEPTEQAVLRLPVEQASGEPAMLSCLPG